MHVASIFRIEEAKQETSVKQVALCLPPAHAGFLLGLFSTLKIDAMCSSETSIDIQWTTRRYIPEDSTLNLWRMFTSYLIELLVKI
jgi:hypothetical protein